MPHPDLNLDALRKIAEGATQGEWKKRCASLPWDIRASGSPVAEVYDDGDAAFVTTFDPPTTQTMLDAMDKSQTEIVRLLDVVRRFEARAEAAEASLAQAVEMARREDTISNDDIRLAVVDFMRDMNSPHLPHEACAKLLARRLKKLAADADVIRAIAGGVDG